MASAREVVLGIVPPYLIAAGLKLRRAMHDRNWIFEGSGDAFKRLAGQASVYGEYGCGESTRWMLQNSTVPVYAVDTSREWLENVRGSDPGDGRLHLHWSDLGPLGAWGTPTGYDRRADFGDYTDWLWEQDERPDLILVDGRFRVACFLTSLLRADAGSWIIIDDYSYRPEYRIVESVVPLTEMSGRQGVFQVPELTAQARAEAAELLERFRYVMD